MKFVLDGIPSRYILQRFSASVRSNINCLNWLMFLYRSLSLWCHFFSFLIFYVTVWRLNCINSIYFFFKKLSFQFLSWLDVLVFLYFGFFFSCLCAYVVIFYILIVILLSPHFIVFSFRVLAVVPAGRKVSWGLAWIWASVGWWLLESWFIFPAEGWSRHRLLQPVWASSDQPTAHQCSVRSHCAQS